MSMEVEGWGKTIGELKDCKLLYVYLRVIYTVDDYGTSVFLASDIHELVCP